jgi:hypothetical protein
LFKLSIAKYLLFCNQLIDSFDWFKFINSRPTRFSPNASHIAVGSQSKSLRRKCLQPQTPAPAVTAVRLATLQRLALNLRSQTPVIAVYVVRSDTLLAFAQPNLLMNRVLLAVVVVVALLEPRVVSQDARNPTTSLASDASTAARMVTCPLTALLLLVTLLATTAARRATRAMLAQARANKCFFFTHTEKKCGSFSHLMFKRQHIHECVIFM